MLVGARATRASPAAAWPCASRCRPATGRGGRAAAVHDRARRHRRPTTRSGVPGTGPGGPRRPAVRPRLRRRAGRCPACWWVEPTTAAAGSPPWRPADATPIRSDCGAAGDLDGADAGRRRPAAAPTRFTVTSSPAARGLVRGGGGGPRRAARRARPARWCWPARSSSRPTGPCRAGRVLEQLRRAYPAAMLFAADGFVGASPELLVARIGRPGALAPDGRHRAPQRRSDRRRPPGRRPAGVGQGPDRAPLHHRHGARHAAAVVLLPRRGGRAVDRGHGQRAAPGHPGRGPAVVARRRR